jgi:hypothetical protein
VVWQAHVPFITMGPGTVTPCEARWSAVVCEGNMPFALVFHAQAAIKVIVMTASRKSCKGAPALLTNARRHGICR